MSTFPSNSKPNLNDSIITSENITPNTNLTPRAPNENELTQVFEFLNRNLRPDSSWSIAQEYPTTLLSHNRHNMRIVSDNKQIYSHAVLKPVIVKSPHVIYKVGAIGSVVTHINHRGMGYSKKTIESCIAAAKDQQCDIVILWTNLYDFYRKLGFELAGSEISFTFEEDFEHTPSEPLNFSSQTNISPEALVRLYSQHTVSTIRTTEEFKKFMSIPNTKIHTAWKLDGQLAAYAIEGKGADLVGYIHEWGGGVSALTSLLSYIRKQKGTSFTIIVPKHSHNLISHIQKTAGVIQNHGYLGMVKVINFAQFSAKIKRAFRAEGIADIVLEKHADNFIFGIGNELFTIQNEGALTQLLFGPVDYKELNIFSEAALQKLNKVLPLNFWLWGWDSI